MHCLDRYHQKWGLFARAMLHLGEWAGCVFPHQTIAVSKTIQNYILNEYHKRTIYIPNGVRPDPIHNSKLLIDAWGLEPNRYLLMVSRLIKHKGAHYLLQAWQIARQRHPQLFKNYKLAIVGGASFTDKYAKELKEIARGDHSIIFTGWQTGQPLAELYANALLFVHPSENEGLPITILQAMSYAKPVLVSDIPEHKEIITDDNYWFVNANIYSLTDKITGLIQYQNKLNTTGIKNKETVKKKYNWQDITNTTIELYTAATDKEALRKYKIA